MAELKPCPFCGWTKVEVSNMLEDWPEMAEVGLSPNNWRVLCTECYASGGVRRTAEEAVEAWNSRVGDDLMERMGDDGT